MARQDHSTTTQPSLVSVYRQALSSGVSLDELDHKAQELHQRSQTAAKVEHQLDEQQQTTLVKQQPWWMRFGAYALPVSFIALGLFLVGSAVVPISSSYISSLPIFAEEQLTHPIPSEQVLSEPLIAVSTDSYTSQATASQAEGPEILDAQLDYTNLANWFSDTQLAELDAGTEDGEQYVIDIPKLNIKNAVVVIGGTDLNSGLIQYPGTADPGDHGAPVIFGHSVLRQFYNPSESNPRRYVSIFSTIMTLQPGDEIFVTKDGVKYRYLMREKVEVKPEDVHILTQNYNSQQLKLVTCTPEGTYLRRGVVTAQLVSS